MLDRLLGAASYHESPDILSVARQAAALYRDADIPVPDVDWAAYESCFETERSAELVAG